MSRVGAPSWEARRDGDIYCAPACGGKCTWKAYQEAQERGNRIVKELGKGWSVRVHENLGWHVTVLSPCMRIKVVPHLVHGTWMGTLETYTAYFGDPEPMASGKWVESGDTPHEAVNAVISTGKAELAKMGALFKRLPLRK